MGCHFFLQGIFWTQELNSSPQHCRATRESLRGEGRMQGLRRGMQVLGWVGPSIGGRAPHTQRVDRRSVVKNI